MISKTFIELYKSIFIARTDFYWKYNRGMPFLNKFRDEPIRLVDDDIENVISGNKTLGVSMFTDNNNVKYGIIDIDAHTADSDTLKDVLKKQLDAKDRMYKYSDELRDKATFLVNSSGSNNGWHIRIYPPKPVSAVIMREYLAELQKKLFGALVDEIYPKQDCLDEITKYGNQVKLPLVIHQKHNRRALIYDIDEKELIPLEKTIGFLLNFATEIENAKPIFVNTNIRITRKYRPIEDDGEEYIPPYCAVIEDYATKFQFPSGAYIRHHYIDPNVAVYAKTHQHVEYSYLQAQGKPRYALRSWAKRINKFRCWQIQAYMKHYENQPLMKKCLGKCKLCPYNNREVVSKDLNSIESSNKIGDNNV